MEIVRSIIQINAERDYKISHGAASKVFTILIGFGVIAFFPILVCLYSAGIILFLGNYNKDRFFYLSHGILIITGFSLAAASRSIGTAWWDDFNNIYWNQFLEVKEVGLSALFLNQQYIDGISRFEVGLKLIFVFLNLFGFQFSKNGVLFFITLLNSAIFLFALDKFIRIKLGSYDKWFVPLIIICGLSLFSYGLSTQLMRQMFASSLLLHCFFTNGKKKWLFLLASVLFHQTSLLIFLIYQVAYKGLKYILFSFLILIVLVNLYEFSDFFLGAFEFLSYIGLDKADFYVDFNLLDESVIGYNYVFLPQAFGLLFLLSLSLTKKKDKADSALYGFLLVIIALYFVLLPIPLAAARVSLIVFSVFLGPMIVYLWPKSLYLARAPFSVLLISVQVLRYLFFVDRGDFKIWANYEPLDIIPFYYIKYLVSYF